MRTLFSLTLLAITQLACATAGQSTPVAFTGVHLIPVAGPEIDDGVLVIQDGRIVSMGGAGTSIPEGAQVIDGTGKVLMPGLVDTHSHIGDPWGGDGSVA